MSRIFVTTSLAFALASCGGSSSAANTVGMTSAQRFDPATITVAVGTTVTWSNDDAQTHTVTAYQNGIPDGGAYFASGDLPDEEAARDDLQAGLLAEGDAYEVTFDEPGTYRYFCVPHEEQGMTGEVVVEP